MSSPLVSAEDFKLSPMSHDDDDASTNSDLGEEDELSEISTTSPCSPNSPMLSTRQMESGANGKVTQTNAAAARSSGAAATPNGSLLPLIERPRRMTKREQLDRLDLLEQVKKTRKLTTEEKKEFQRLRRRKQNRDAAATSRDRKRDYTSSLESTIKLLQDKQAEMQRTIDTLLKERQVMLAQLKQVDAPAAMMAEVKDAECSKHGKKRGLAECVNVSSVVSDCSSSLNSSLPLLSAAELAGDGSGNANQQENNAMVQVSQHEEAIDALNHIQAAVSSVNAHAFAASATAAVADQASHVSDSEVDTPPSKRVKLDCRATVEDEALSAPSAMVVSNASNDELISAVSHSDVSALSLDGLNEAILNPLPLSNADTIFDSSSYFESLEISPSFLPPIGTLQREDSLGGLCMAMQEPYGKTFAAQAFPLTPFNEGQLV